MSSYELEPVARYLFRIGWGDRGGGRRRKILNGYSSGRAIEFLRTQCLFDTTREKQVILSGTSGNERAVCQTLLANPTLNWYLSWGREPSSYFSHTIYQFEGQVNHPQVGFVVRFGGTHGF